MHNYTIIFTIFFLLKPNLYSQDLGEMKEGNSVIPDSIFSITFTTIGGYGGFIRLKYQFQKNENGQVVKSFFWFPEGGTSHTEYDEQGRIKNYPKVEYPYKDYSLNNDQVISLEKIIYKLDSLGITTDQNFNAALYCYGLGDCQHIGFWGHFKSKTKSYFVFGFEASKIQGEIIDLLNEKNNKLRRKRKLFTRKK